MVTVLDQVIAYGSDSAGLERLLRLFQSVGIILTSFPLLIATLLPNYPASFHLTVATSLFQFQTWLNVTRRLLRLVRFLEAFQRGWILYVAPTDKSIDAWLDVMTATSLGMYGLIESATMMDIIQIENLEIFGPKRTKEWNLQAQVFWFAALYSSALSSGIKLLRVLAYRAVPSPEVIRKVESAGTEKVSDEEPLGTQPSLVKALPTDQKKLNSERDKLRQSLQQTKKQKAAAADEFRTNVVTHSLNMIVSLLDMVIPVAVLGWLHIQPGLVGVAMLCTTLITMRNVWKKCGQQLESRLTK